MNTYEDYIQDALEMVSAWEVPEEEFSEAVMGQARIMAGLNLEPAYSDPLPSAYSPLQF
jgi:hypothetical protein